MPRHALNLHLDLLTSGVRFPGYVNILMAEGTGSAGFVTELR